MRAVLTVLLLCCFFSYATAQRRVPSLEEMVRRLDSLSKAHNNAPKITDVTFANVDPIGTIINDFGEKLYERELQYLVPRIKYDASSDCQMDLTMKLSGGDGVSVSEDLLITFKKGSKRYSDDLGPVCGGLDAGDYIYELWNGNTKMHSGRLSVAAGSPKVKDCSIFKVKDIKFGNASNDKLISEFGAKLYAADVRFLTSAIYYSDLVNKTALTSAKYFLRIYTPEGILMKCNDSSVLGYTTCNSVRDTNINSEYFLINGIGNDEVQIYQPGSYRYEVWMENSKIVDTKVNLY